VLNGYTVCGQYPGVVGASATVSLKCDDSDLPPARYVIVQFPVTDYMNFCELDVCARGSSSFYVILRPVFFYWRLLQFMWYLVVKLYREFLLVNDVFHLRAINCLLAFYFYCVVLIHFFVFSVLILLAFVLDYVLRIMCFVAKTASERLNRINEFWMPTVHTPVQG